MRILEFTIVRMKYFCNYHQRPNVMKNKEKKWRTKFWKVLNNRIIFVCRQAFTIANNMASSGLWKMFYRMYIFHRTNEAMMFVMVKACLHANIILLFRTFENLVLHLYVFKQNEKASFTHPNLGPFM